MKVFVRKWFLRSGKGTQWDLLKAMVISGTFGLAASVGVYSPSPKTIVLAVGASVLFAVLLFFIARPRHE